MQAHVHQPSPILFKVIYVALPLLLAGGITLAILLHASPHTFAATLPNEAFCAQAPSAEHCDGQDPQVQGCSADAQTLGQADITQNGVVIGSVERRYSAKCQSWWGRVVALHPGANPQMAITVGSTTQAIAPQFTSGQYSILYSHLTFASTPSEPFPAISGEIDPDRNTALQVALPPIQPPGIAG